MLKIKNKIIIAITIFLLITITFINKAFASYEDITVLEIPQEIYQALYETEEYKSDKYYYSFRYNGDIFSVLFVSKEKYPNLKQYISNDVQNMGKSYCIYFNTVNSEIEGVLYEYNNNTFIKTNYTSHGYFYTTYFNNSIYLGGNIDIYTDGTYKTIFFQEAPQVTIKEITQVEEITTITTKTIQVIIPIGLIILSIGLLIYVIKSVISRVT